MKLLRFGSPGNLPHIQLSHNATQLFSEIASIEQAPPSCMKIGSFAEGSGPFSSSSDNDCFLFSGLFSNNPASFTQMLTSFSMKPLAYLKLNLGTADISGSGMQCHNVVFRHQ